MSGWAQARGGSLVALVGRWVVCVDVLLSWLLAMIQPGTEDVVFDTEAAMRSVHPIGLVALKPWHRLWMN